MSASVALPGLEAKASRRPGGPGVPPDDDASLQAEHAELRADNAGLRTENERLRSENGRLQARVRTLTAEVEELRRAAKRQAAPFSKGEPKASPRRPGRRPGEGYGPKARRAIPDHIDELVAVPLPEACPHCGGELVLERVAFQYQEELPPVRPSVRCYRLAVGRCLTCRRRVQARHPEQTSDALGAAAAQVGPRGRRDGGALGGEELAAEVEALQARLDKLLAGRVTHPPNRRLLKHLRNERGNLFTFLTLPGVEATSWWAEQALRPAVVNRKHWGGNRSWAGAKTQETLMSVLRSCRQQGLDPVELLVGLARERRPGVASELAIPGRAPVPGELPLAA